MDILSVSPEGEIPARNKKEWGTVIRDVDDSVRFEVSRLVAGIAHLCADSFYDTLLSNPEAAIYISSETVHERLHTALMNWLIFLFPENQPDVDELIALQERVGIAHARMRIPMMLVLQGIRTLKQTLRRRLFELDMSRDRLLAALSYMMTMTDIAVEVMSQEFSKDLKKEIESDEACRLVTLGQDIAVEKETQRAALLDWGHRVLLAICCSSPPPLPSLAKSSFGLWINHKAIFLFSGLPGLQSVREIVSRIDDELLPALMDVAPVPPAQIHALQEQLDEIRFLMDDMFVGSALLEGGRDPLTAALSRRFLPTILSREITLSLRRGVSFCLLFLDVDHFKRINDQFGHTHGDSVLRSIYEIIFAQCRPSDFVFRYGGEEFLVALTETVGEQGVEVAERIRKAVLSDPELQNRPVTVSIGISEFSGHPDYEELVHEADAALYQAKAQGRNRCVLHYRRRDTVSDAEGVAFHSG